MPMTDLSPAAKAVVAAIEKIDWEDGHFSREEIWHFSKEVVAAAFRAAADQVVPEEPLYYGDQRWQFERDARQHCRQQLLAIADELEAQ